MRCRAAFTITLFFGSIVALGSSACKRQSSGDGDGGKLEEPKNHSLAKLTEDVPTNDAGQKRQAESLLTWTDSRVAVSSTVDNPRDFPEHLIDKKLDTAWNGKTGDLVHGFIAFRVPRTSHVEKILLTAGYTAKAKDGRDLFTTNHRISGARITRDGAPFRDIVPDIQNRGVQAFDIDAPGGDYKIEILEVVPGSNPNWKELVVSEFDVLGDPGPAKLDAPHMPRVRTGSLDADQNDAGKTDGSTIVATIAPTSIDAYCKAFVKKEEPAVVAEFSSPNFPCNDPKEHATCAGHVQTVIKNNAPFATISTIDYAGADTAGTDFVITTQNGAFDRIGGDARGRCELGDPGSETFNIISTENSRARNGIPEVRVVAESTEYMPEYVDPETNAPGMWVQITAKRMLFACLAEGERPRCNNRGILGTYRGRSDPPPPFEQWESPQKYYVNADGAVMLAPLFDAGSP